LALARATARLTICFEFALGALLIAGPRKLNLVGTSISAREALIRIACLGACSHWVNIFVDHVFALDGINYRIGGDEAVVLGCLS